jgi:hypothetical protein
MKNYCELVAVMMLGGFNGERWFRLRNIDSPEAVSSDKVA